jgi:hypothetical protein
MTQSNEAGAAVFVEVDDSRRCVLLTSLRSIFTFHNGLFPPPDESTGKLDSGIRPVRWSRSGRC